MTVSFKAAVATLTVAVGMTLAGLATGETARAEHVKAMKGVQQSAVVELFTSQGCSSCPPADRYLGELAKRDDILALSYNVDIWDWIGWRDTLADSEFTDRQRAYARAMGARGVYTPQAIIDGISHMPGSDRNAIEAALADEKGGLTVPVDVSVTNDSISVQVGAAPEDGPDHAMLWLALYQRSVTVPIERGENAGATLTYNNVVRELRPVALWKGKPIAVEQSRSELEQENVDGCAFFLQVERPDGRPGQMLGAARLSTKK